jgi:hypothetical protein
MTGTYATAVVAGVQVTLAPQYNPTQGVLGRVVVNLNPVILNVHIQRAPICT